jgi:tetratricopeptide (TPR) repeat protein
MSTQTLSQPAPRKAARRHQLTWLRALSAGIAVLVLAALAPVIWLAAAGSAGLLVLGGLLAIGVALLQALPLAAQKLENRLLAARKAEARRNPIEQLHNELLRRAERLKVFRRALVTVGAQIESITQMIAARRHRDPAHVLEQQERALQRLKQFHALNLERLQNAEQALQDFRATIERKESEWRIALAIEEATAALDPDAAEGLLNDLLADTALRSVQDRFNAVFAELDVQMSSVDAPTRTLLEPAEQQRMRALELPLAAADLRQREGRPSDH